MHHRIRSYSLVAAVLLLTLPSLHCGGDDLECGPGATRYGDRCVAQVSSCAAGTHLVDGECVPLCAPNESWTGSACVADRLCAPGTALVGGECVPDCGQEGYWDGEKCAKVPRCALGTVFDEELGACVPDEMICAEGTHFVDGTCVPDTTDCGPGTHLSEGVCVPDVLPAPDVEESTNPTGVAVFDLPEAGESITLGGTVDTPEDLNGDGYVDPDYDRFSFTASAGTWLRVHATSEGAAHPAFVLISNEAGGQGPLYARYALNPGGVDTQREFYLPRDGEYTLIVSDYSHVAADLFGWMSLPLGGDDFTYFITLENLGEPTPQKLSSVPAIQSGNMTNGALAFFELSDLSVNDVRVIRSMGKPLGQMNSDIFGALMLFGPGGNLLRENLAYSTGGDATLLFGVTGAGDHLVVVDQLLAIGTIDAYEMRAEDVATVDCQSANCSTGTIEEGTSKLLSWDVVAGTVFVAGAYVPDTAPSTLRVQIMDAGLVPVGSESSASKYGPAKLRHYMEADQRIYMLLYGQSGAEVPTYTLDARTLVVDLLSSGAVHSGLSVYEMPPETYPAAGLGRFPATEGQVLVSTGFSTTWPAWSHPVESYLSHGFENLPHPLDVTDPGFPNSPLQPLMAFVPETATYLYQVTDQNAGDIVGANYDTTFHAITPPNLGVPVVGTPVGLTGQSLLANAGWAAFRFSATAGSMATVTVSPEGGALMQPEVWIGTPGRRQYASGTHTWISDPDEAGLGMVARDEADAPGGAVSVHHSLDYDGIHLIFVRDLGAGDPAEPFDVEVAISN